MLQHVSSKMWPHRNILMGWSSAPIKGTPRLSTRFIFCFCFGGDFSLSGEIWMAASVSLSGAKSNGSRHIGHCYGESCLHEVIISSTRLDVIEADLE